MFALLGRALNYLFNGSAQPVVAAPIVAAPVVATAKPTNYKKISKKTRKLVWENYHGLNRFGICYACGTDLDSLKPYGWHCSHVIANNMGGDPTVENLRTCCYTCNLKMKDTNLYSYIISKNLNGPGRKNANRYFNKYPEQRAKK
jgi:hypothetical protein